MNGTPRCLVLILTTLATGAAIADEPAAGSAGADEGSGGARDRPREEEGAFYFPPKEGRWARVDPAAVGWDPAKIEAALTFAGERASSGVVILHRGRILAERYWDREPTARLPGGRLNRYFHMLHGKDPVGRAVEDVASVQKSVVSVLAGIAQEKGLLSVGDPVHKHLGPGWSKAPRDAEAKITLRHLIAMSSGLSDQLEYVAPPGTIWRYNTAAYSRTLLAVAAAAGKEANELTREWLTGPIGMGSSRWVERRRPDGGDVVNRFGFATTARDLARFGLLVLARGQWKGQSVIGDRRYLTAALEPSQKMNPSYGYLWWLNGQRSIVRGSRTVRGPLIPGAPDDLVAALGALGRKLYVVPSLDLVVTRLGDSPNAAGQARFDSEFWKRLMAAAPAGQSKR